MELPKKDPLQIAALTYYQITFIEAIPAVLRDPVEVALGDGGEEDVNCLGGVCGQVVVRNGEVGDAQHREAVVDKIPAEEHVHEVQLFEGRIQ